MSGPPRGPPGVPVPPPDDLAALPLPIIERTPSDTFHRIHRTAHAPLIFSPGTGQPPAGRFDSSTGAFGVLYCAETFAGAFTDTVLRNPTRRLIGMAEITSRSLAIITAQRPIRLVDLRGEGLQQLGLDGSIATGPYDHFGPWADALFHHPAHTDGILYRSRHDPAETCIALFERDGLGLTPMGDSVPLAKMLTNIGAVLRRDGKAADAA